MNVAFYTLLYIMAGLYIHIPFCASRCVYCGFYSTTYGQLKQAYVDALCKEIEELEGGQSIDTVYLGGGTPSQLTIEQLELLLQKVGKHFSLSQNAEITMECNPDDITLDYAESMQELRVNRVSLGIQTFDDARLHFLHRRHTASQAISAVSTLRQTGFDNISVDLMFGFPDESLDEWERDIRKAVNLDVKHISAYSLMYEEGTPLYNQLQAGFVKEIDEELSLKMYEILIDHLTSAGFEHYEISNFAKLPSIGTDSFSSFRSRHNSSYWKGIPYFGIGAAAHSYDGQRRWWNKSDLHQYIFDIQSGESPVEESEWLSQEMKYNDMVTTALRTCEGIDVGKVLNEFGMSFRDYIMKSATQHLQRGTLSLDNGRLRLTRQGLFVSNDIMSDLVFVS